RIIGRAPTNDERTEGLAQLNGDLASRSAYTASLLRSDALQTTTTAQLIYRTMTGEWPDASELNDARNTLTNGGTGVVSADALTLALIPEYEARFAVLNTDVGFMRQIFRNKHGVAPTAQTEVILFNALVGGSVEFNGTFIPGYGGNVTAYATQFALDNELSGFIGVEGLPLTNIHYYSKPNAPESKTLLVTLVSTLLGVEPTDGEIAALSALSLESAVSQVLQDPRYFGQFPTSDAESAFAQTMAGFGVFDINLNGPDDDADGDGISNADEILLGTSPADGGATPTQKDVLVAQFLSQSFGFTTVGLNAADDDADADGQSNLMEIALGSDPTDAGDMAGTLPASIDGSDFVVTFLRLQDPSAGLIYTVQCSPMMELGSWNDADPLASTTLAPDQSGVPAGYERIEFRIDMNTQDCAFVRVVVN
ncbi:MAG: hypothetical protein ISQ75_08285, partial [Puniceicoccaceae bacterium]|nr:hypothetical protein [Puniceicoccaceae bacterium]